VRRLLHASRISEDRSFIRALTRQRPSRADKTETPGRRLRRTQQPNADKRPQQELLSAGLALLSRFSDERAGSRAATTTRHVVRTLRPLIASKHALRITQVQPGSPAGGRTDGRTDGRTGGETKADRDAARTRRGETRVDARRLRFGSG